MKAGEIHPISPTLLNDDLLPKEKERKP